MSMMNHWRINVSHCGVHLFATEPNSCRSFDTAKIVYRELRKRFPASEKFEVEVTHWKGVGYRVMEEELEND